MSSAVIAVTAGATAGAGPFNLAIPGTGAGNALVAVGKNLGGGARVVSSNGTGTWTQVADNASFLCVWVCLNPGTGTTQVSLAATGSGYALVAYEVSGLKAAGAAVASTFGGASTAAWTTPAIAPAAASMSLAVAYQGTDNTTTSSIPGFTLSSGTGVVSGAAADGANFSVIMSGTKDIASGAGQTAAGTWTGALVWVSVYVAFELAPATVGGGSSAMLGSAIGAC